MRLGLCPDCKKIKRLTRHSKIGSHRPPLIEVCRDCHDKRDEMEKPKRKINKKYQKGTKRVHKKQ
jgi:hypothetical protein